LKATRVSPPNISALQALDVIKSNPHHQRHAHFIESLSICLPLLSSKTDKFNQLAIMIVIMQAISIISLAPDLQSAAAGKELERLAN
jgi:hypothetical protein